MRNTVKLSAVGARYGPPVCSDRRPPSTGKSPEPSPILRARPSPARRCRPPIRDTGLKQSVKTGDSGLYRFTLLPLGPYEVEVQAPGFGTKKVTGIVLSAGAIATVDVALAVSGTATTVEVIGARHHHRAQPHRSGQHARVRT